MAKESFMGRPVTRNSPAEFERDAAGSLGRGIAEEMMAPVKKLGEAAAPYADKVMETGKRLFGGTDKKKAEAERERNYQEELKRRGIKPAKGR